MTCQKELMAAGKPYPRTCEDCGLFAPCKKGYDPQWTPNNPVGKGPTSGSRSLQAKEMLEKCLKEIDAIGIDVFLVQNVEVSGDGVDIDTFDFVVRGTR